MASPIAFSYHAQARSGELTTVPPHAQLRSFPGIAVAAGRSPSYVPALLRPGVRGKTSDASGGNVSSGMACQSGIDCQYAVRCSSFCSCSEIVQSTTTPPSPPSFVCRRSRSCAFLRNRVQQWSLRATCKLPAIHGPPRIRAGSGSTARRYVRAGDAQGRGAPLCEPCGATGLNTSLAEL